MQGQPAESEYYHETEYGFSHFPSLKKRQSTNHKRSNANMTRVDKFRVSIIFQRTQKVLVPASYEH